MASIKLMSTLMYWDTLSSWLDIMMNKTSTL